jgi:hypothetical protein
MPTPNVRCSPRHLIFSTKLSSLKIPSYFARKKINKLRELAVYKQQMNYIIC